jgi:hypothetical protein
MAQPVAAGIVEGHDAAHRGHASRRGVWPELPSKRSQVAIELAQDHAGLHRHRVSFDTHDPPHGPAKINDQSAAKRLPGQPGPCAAGDQRN